MASDEAMIHHILGLLDRHSFKTLEHAIQQFKDHKQRFHESLFELKSLKPPTGGDFLNVFTHPAPHSMQARCTPLKPSAGGDFLNVSAHPSSHGMQARCTPLKPPLSSTFVQEGTENRGSKQYTLRSRAPKKLVTSGAPQRITRSRAKQPATSTAAACNLPTKTDFMVLVDEPVEVRTDVNREPEQHQQASFQGEIPAEATTSGCGKAYPIQSHEHECQLLTSSQDVLAVTTAEEQPVLCKRELLTPSSMKSFKNPDKEGFISGDTVIGFNSTEQFCPLSPHLAQQFPSSEIGNLVTPCRSIGNCYLHLHNEAPILGTSHRSSLRTHSIGTGAAVLAKSPTMYVRSPKLADQALKETNAAVQCNTKQENLFFTKAEDGTCVVCFKEHDAPSLQLSPMTVKQSPSSIRKKIHGTNLRQSILGKRKLSVSGDSTSGIAADDYHNASKRIAISRNSIDLEAFKFDSDDEFSVKGGSKLPPSLCRVNKKSNSVPDVHYQARRPASKRVSIPGNMNSAKTNEFDIGTIETGLGGLTNCVASEGPCGTLSQVHYEVAGSEAIVWDDSSHLRYNRKPAVQDSILVTTQEAHQAREKVQPSFDSAKRAHTEESNCDNQTKTPEKQGNLVSDFALTDQPLVSEMDSSAVSFSAKKEMGLLSRGDLLVTTSIQGVDPCLHELAEVKLTSSSRTTIHATEPLASGNTTAVYDDLPQEKAADKVMFSHTLENSKGDVFSSPKTSEIQGILVSEFTLTDQLLVSENDRSAARFSARLQPEQEKEMGSLNKGGLLVTTSIQGIEPCLHELADDKLTLCSRTTINPSALLASERTATVCDDFDHEKAVDKVRFSHTWENPKGDVFSSPKLKELRKDCTSLSPGMRRSPTSNNVEQIESNVSKSMLKYHFVKAVADFSCDECMPGLESKGEFTSVSITPFVSMSSAGKEKAAADNVLVGTNADSHSLHRTVGNNENILHNMEEKTFFSMEAKPGPGTQLGCTFESAVGQILSRCDFSSKEFNEIPGQVTSTTKAGSNLKLEQGAWVSEVTNSSGLASTRNLDGCETASKIANKDALPVQALELGDLNMESSGKTVSMGPNFTIHINSPIPSPPREKVSATKMAPLMPEMKKTESCCWDIKLEMPCSQDTECDPSWRPEVFQYGESTLKGASLGVPSPSALKNELSVESSVFIPDMEINERTAFDNDDEDDVNNTGSQMDCSESPNSSFRLKADDQLHRENETTTEWKFTPNGDDDILRFSQILAQGTVNSSRRKRARSPANFSEESCKDFKKMKVLSIENDGQISDEQLPHIFLPQRPSFGKSNSLYGFPNLSSPVRRYQDTFGMTFQDSPCSKLHDSGGFDSLQRQMKGSNKLCKSYSRLSALRREYLDTPHMRSARGDLVDRTSAKFKVQKSERHLHTHLEEDGKENQTPESWLRDKSFSSTSILSEMQATANTRKVLGQANQSLGPVESSYKRYNLAVETTSFLDLVQQKQLPLPYPNGKREVRVKALEAAELARRQEERRENERKMRRLECNEAKNNELECVKDKMMQSGVSTTAGKGVTCKMKRAAELKMKMDQEKARKQEVEQKKKEEERKKKEVEFADKKRKREDADRKEREEKRKRVEEVQRLRKEQEERQRLELNEKELKRKMQEERERERKAQEEEAKRQRRLEKEREAERRRKQEQHFKAARFAEKQAERKRKEAMVQARGYEDDPIAQLALGNKLSFISTESLAVSTSIDWEPQSKSVIRTRSQISEDRWGLRVPSLGTSVYCQTNTKEIPTSASFVENGPFFSTKKVVHEAGSKCDHFKGLRSQSSTPYTPGQLTHLESKIQSYEISPYKSSSDEDEDEDEQSKKPIPLWARKENLLPQILGQQCIDPDDIFSSEKTCSLAEIFGTSGSRRCKNFTQRSASGDWLDDRATCKEEVDYKIAMGYIQG